MTTVAVDPAKARKRRRRRIVSWTLTALLAAAFALVAMPGLYRGEWIVVSGTSMEPGMHTGDMVLAVKTNDWKIGDTVTYRLGNPDDPNSVGGFVIHRLVSGDAVEGWRTRGDNKPNPDAWVVADSQILGEQVLMVPKMGFVLAQARSPWVLALIAGILVALAIGISEASGPKAPPYFFDDAEFGTVGSTRSGWWRR
jgi:signal peptidase